MDKIGSPKRQQPPGTVLYTSEERMFSLGGHQPSTVRRISPADVFYLSYAQDRFLEPMLNTMLYRLEMVTEADTITSIAAHFNMGVSELKKVNKLMGTNATVFPGQSLFVSPIQTVVHDSSSNSVEKDSSASLSRNSTDNPGNSVMSATDRERHPSVSWKYDEPNGIRVRDMFCKISNTRYVTDGAGAVKGSLLITVTSVIFDPDKSDDLVKEEVADYTVAVPIENVLQMAFYTDIAAKNDTRSYASSVYRGTAESSNVSSTADLKALSENESNLSEVNSSVVLDNISLSSNVSRNNSHGRMVSSAMNDVTDASSLQCTEIENAESVMEGRNSQLTEDPDNERKQNLDGCSINCAAIDVPQVVKSTFVGNNLALPLVPNRHKHSTTEDAKFAIPENLPVGSPAQFVFDDLALAPVGHNLATISEHDASQTESGNKNENCAAPIGINCMSPSASRGQFLARLAMENKASPSPRSLQQIISQPRISETGSFVMPSHWETYCDFDCGYFSVAPEDVGLVKDVSLLPAPSSSLVAAVPTFSVGDDNDFDDAADVLKMVSCTPVDRPLEVEMTSLNYGTRGPSQFKIEMVDATSRDILTEIFNKTAELLIKPATRYTELPMYLCVRTGWLPGEKLPAIRSPMSDGENHRMQPEYWFAIPKRQVEHVYQFIQRRLPAGLYGSDDEIEPARRGFETLSLDELKAKIDIAYREQALKENKLCLTDIELLNLPLPELSEPSIIMNAGHLNQLNRHLLPIAVGCQWVLSYSSENHGYSLQTLYNKLKDVTSPVLIIIKDMYDSVFGAMLPTKLRICRECYGSGEMFLFTFSPRFKKFPWSGMNSYFINSNADGVYFGAGNGKCGLYIDAELNHGRSESCETFNNDPLEPQTDFLARQIEVWSFAV